jgi:hypothetical protein
MAHPGHDSRARTRYRGDFEHEAAAMQSLQLAVGLVLLRKAREAHEAGRHADVAQLLELAEQELAALVRETGWMSPEPARRVQ